eukprot:11402018-Karenia_brevis.AAC.1
MSTSLGLLTRYMHWKWLEINGENGSVLYAFVVHQNGFVMIGYPNQMQCRQLMVWPSGHMNYYSKCRMFQTHL